MTKRAGFIVLGNATYDDEGAGNPVAFDEVGPRMPVEFDLSATGMTIEPASVPLEPVGATCREYALLDADGTPFYVWPLRHVPATGDTLAISPLVLTRI